MNGQIIEKSDDKTLWKALGPKRLLCVLLVAGTLFGCVRMGVDLIGAPMVSGILEKVMDFSNPRLVKEGLAAQAIQVSALAEISPHNSRLLKETAFLHCALGLFVEDEDPEYAKEVYQAGKEYGIRALMLDPGFRKAVSAGGRISDAVGLLGRDYAQPLCWAGLAGGLRLILSLDDPATLVEMADVVAMVERSMALEPDYFFGICKVFMGAYYGMVPSYAGLGGGPANSLAMFARAREVTEGKLLLTDLFEARFLATTIGDELLFEERLSRVLEADPAALEGANLINALAKIKARHYQEHMEEYF